MKINEINRAGSINPYRKTADHRSGDSAAKRSRKDEALFSSEALELQGASGNANQEQRIGKIQELKDAVSSGVYHVPARQIAEKVWPYIK